VTTVTINLQSQPCPKCNAALDPLKWRVNDGAIFTTCQGCGVTVHSFMGNPGYGGEYKAPYIAVVEATKGGAQ
jgi:hypothetical protein